MLEEDKRGGSVMGEDKKVKGPAANEEERE